MTCFVRVDRGAVRVFDLSGVSGLGYSLPWLYLDVHTKHIRQALAHEFIKDVFQSVNTNAQSRWKNEQARGYTKEGRINIHTTYGQLNTGKMDDIPYPDQHEALSPGTNKTKQNKTNHKAKHKAKHTYVYIYIHTHIHPYTPPADGTSRFEDVMDM